MTALEHLQLKTGAAGCPLGYDFKKYGCLASNTWAKLLWEKVQDMNIEVKLDYKDIEPPRGRRDKCLMEIFGKDPGAKE